MINEVSLSLSIYDLGFLSNTIGEAWEAAKINEANFIALTGQSFGYVKEIRKSISALLRQLDPTGSKLHSGTDRTKVKLPIELADVRLLCKTIRVTLDYVEDWEFQTRTGYTPDEARALLAYLEVMIEGAA